MTLLHCRSQVARTVALEKYMTIHPFLRFGHYDDRPLYVKLRMRGSHRTLRREKSETVGHPVAIALPRSTTLVSQRILNEPQQLATEAVRIYEAK
jgi:hypothetical protein